jgi:ribosome-associated translation inhibitor RaiA
MSQISQIANLRVEFDLHQCRLSAYEIRKMETGLVSLGKQVESFPISDLHVLIEHNARSNDYSVKTSLILTGGPLVSSDHDVLPYPAFERCVNNLVENVRAYKDRLGKVPEVQKQNHGQVAGAYPSLDPDAAALERAVADGDFAAFRAAAFGYEEPLRKRIGRWVERYPDVAARIDNGLKIDDIVGAVLLSAFEDYPRRPQGLRFGDWLERLIDPTIKELQRNPDRVLENVNLARSAIAAEQGPEAV